MKMNCQFCKFYKDGYCENLELKPCYPQKGCEYFSKVEQEPILNKIRAEIEDVAFDWQEIDGEHESFMVVDLNDALKIIDKYRKTERSE